MQIDLHFMQKHYHEIGILLLLVFVLNNTINTSTFRTLKVSWAGSLRAGAMLSQIGEFSFVLAAIGYQVGIITDFSYQMTLSLIGLSLLVSLFWVNLVERVVVKRVG